MKYQPHVTFSAQAVAFRALMNMFERVKREEAGDPFDYLPVLVFTAFSIEAYLNSIGNRKISFWNHLERLPWKSKIEILHKQANSVADWGIEPLQFASQVFAIRDRLAHGKPETVAGPICDDSNTAVSILYVQHLQPTVLKDLTKEWVIASGDRLYALLEYLGSLYRLETEDFASFSTSRVERHETPGAEV